MIKATSEWDQSFFNLFLNLRNDIYKNNRYFIPEQISDFEGMLGPNTPFSLNNNWCAWIIFNSENKPVGRVFASTRKLNNEFKQFDFLPFGYFESDSTENAKRLLELVEDWALKQQYKVIRGPIQGNVFNSSRFITERHGKPFYGEPIHRPDYVDYFKDAGLSISQKWITAHFGLKARVAGMVNFITKFSKNKARNKLYKIRRLNLANWDCEFKLIYHLLMDSFVEMDDVEIISFEEFKFWSEGIKEIIEEKNCLVLEYENEPLGFIIAYHDLLPQIAALYRSNNFINKLRFILAKKFFKGPLLMNYLGKKNEAEGVVKGVSPKLFAKLAKNNNGFIFHSSYMGFISEHSKTLEIVPKVYNVSARYVMFEKSIL